MEIGLFLIIVAVTELLLAVIAITVAIKCNFKNFGAVFQIVLIMLFISLVTFSSISCKIVDYDNGTSQKIVSEATLNSDCRTYNVCTVDNYKDERVQLYVFSTDIEKTTLIVNSKVKIKTLLGIPLYIRKNVLVAKPNIDIDKMSVSERKSYFKDINNRRFLLW